MQFLDELRASIEAADPTEIRTSERLVTDLATTARATLATRDEPRSPRPWWRAVAALAAIGGAVFAARASQRPHEAGAAIASVASTATSGSSTASSGACRPTTTTVENAEQKDLGRTSERWCVLAGFTGALDRSERAVGVRAEAGRWSLFARGPGLSATARCVPLSCLAADGDRRYVSSPLRVEESPEGQCVSASGESYWGDAATALAVLEGRFAEPRDAIEVLQSSDGSGASRLRLRACSGPRLAGESHAFFAGRHAAGVPARFFGPTGTGDAFTAGEWSSNGAPVNLVPLARGLCYLTRIQGPLTDQRAAVRIEVAGDLQRLVAPAGIARARCYALDQRGSASP